VTRYMHLRDFGSGCSRDASLDARRADFQLLLSPAFAHHCYTKALQEFNNGLLLLA